MNSTLQTWITAPESESPWFYRSFDISQGQTARITICGLGYFELYCNGKKVSSDLLTPVWSTYEAREGRRSKYGFQPTMTYRVYYLEYDLSSYLRPHNNDIGVWLGNGWYNQHERNIEGDYRYGHPKLAFCIDILENGQTVSRIVSDDNVLWRPSHIVFNNIYFGEKQDYRLYQPDWYFSGDKSDWQHAVLTEAPCAVLEKQYCPSDRVIRKIYPRYIGEAEGGRLYDCGENITGWAVLRSCGEGEVKVRYAEDLDESGNPLYYSNASPNGSQMQEDSFICTAESEILKPHFCWHGFRYFIVFGDAQIINCEVVHSDVAVTSDFHCDNDALNWLFSAYIRTQLGNFHGGVPSDCPHRERLGYTGDGQLTAETALLLTDSVEFYKKWMQDILDCQDMNSGHVQHTAPYYGGGGGPGGWGCAVVQVPFSLYQRTADKEILKRSVNAMLNWLSYMRKNSEGHLITCEVPENGTVPEAEDCMCLGEWCTPNELALPDPFVNTYFYIKSIRQVTEILHILCLDEKIPELEKYAQESLDAFDRAYFDPDTGDFVGGVQAANAFALDIGLGDERTRKNLIDRYKNGALDTGIFGTDILLRKLFEFGEADTAVRLMTRSEYPSYAYMQSKGATTLWESWGGEASRNHPMFGACVRLLFQYLLGIRKSSADSWIIKPVSTTVLQHISGYVTTSDGKITVTIDYTKGEEFIQIINDTKQSISFYLNDCQYELENGSYKFLL